MKLGNYDSSMAKNRAARFLTASIGENPYEEGTIESNAFRLISNEFSSLEALKQ
jgi:hypothetical protein